jgi:hypothetical protein
MNPMTDLATTTPSTERSSPTLDQQPALDQPSAPKLYPLLVPVILVPLRRRRPRPAVLDAWPSGSRKAVRAEKPLLIEPRRRDVEPALRHHAAVPAPIFGGLSRLPSAVAPRNVAVGSSLGCQRIDKVLGFRNSFSLRIGYIVPSPALGPRLRMTQPEAAAEEGRDHTADLPASAQMTSASLSTAAARVCSYGGETAAQPCDGGVLVWNDPRRS